MHHWQFLMHKFVLISLLSKECSFPVSEHSSCAHRHQATRVSSVKQKTFAGVWYQKISVTVNSWSNKKERVGALCDWLFIFSVTADSWSNKKKRVGSLCDWLFIFLVTADSWSNKKKRVGSLCNWLFISYSNLL